MVVMMTMTGALLFNMITLTTRLLSNPVTVNIAVQHQQELTFPAVTMCNMSPVKKSSLSATTSNQQRQQQTSKPGPATASTGAAGGGRRRRKRTAYYTGDNSHLYIDPNPIMLVGDVVIVTHESNSRAARSSTITYDMVIGAKLPFECYTSVPISAIVSIKSLTFKILRSVARSLFLI